MKRGQPLKRKAPLKSDPEAKREFVQRGRGSLKRTDADAALRSPRPCPSCGATFEPRKVGGNWTKTCSYACGRVATAKACRENAAERAELRRLRYPPRRVTLTCEICGVQWQDQPHAVAKRRTCSVACAAELKRRAGGANRRGESNPNWRGGHRAGERDREGERRWYTAAAKRCEHPGCRGGGSYLNLHHCVYAQQVTRDDGDRWDPRNAMTLCASCHTAHHKRGRVVPVLALPASAFEFAVDLMGPGRAYEYIRRRYAGDDPRLDALLAEASA